MVSLLEVTALYDENPDAVFRAALDTAELEAAMSGLAVYDGLPKGVVKEGQTAIVNVTIWGFLKTRNYTMHVETLDMENRILQSREHGGMIKRWDHTLSVVPENGKARWRDAIIIDAGWNTRGAALFGSYMYKRRHRYRRALEITVKRFHNYKE